MGIAGIGAAAARTCGARAAWHVLPVLYTTSLQRHAGAAGGLCSRRHLCGVGWCFVGCARKSARLLCGSRANCNADGDDGASVFSGTGSSARSIGAFVSPHQKHRLCRCQSRMFALASVAQRERERGGVETDRQTD